MEYRVKFGVFILIATACVCTMMIYRKINLISTSNIKEQAKFGSFSDATKKENLAQTPMKESFFNFGKRVNEKIEDLQNPKECKNANLLICIRRINCGVGCLLHQVARCMFEALATNKTMVLDLKESLYGIENVYNIFPNLNRNGECKNLDTKNVVRVHVSTDRPFSPTTFPNGLSSFGKKYNIEESIWWIGQIMNYVSQVSENFAQTIKRKKENMGINGSFPLVGVHIRRTDKLIREAGFIANEIYMKEVKNWYDDLAVVTNNKFIPRTVFVATDDPTVIPQLIEVYKNYTFIYDKGIIDSASVKGRKGESGLEGILVDLNILIDCDFVVCTFSSNICRLVYEISTVKYLDAKNRVVSLDYCYFYHDPMRLLRKHNNCHKKLNNKPLNYANFNFTDTKNWPFEN